MQIATDNTTVVSYINKEVGIRSGSLCALLWRLLSWCHPRGIVLRARHIPGRFNVIADKLSRHNQVIQTESSSAGVQSLVLKMGLATCRPVCNPLQSQTPQVCFTGTGSNSLGSRRPKSTVGKSGCLRLPSSFPARPSNLKGDGSRLSKNDSDCSRVAQHALVLGPGQSIGSDPLQAPTAEGSGDTTLQWASQLETRQSEPTCLAPRASAIQEQGFSDEVAARIKLLKDSQPEQFTNQSGSFLSNGVNQTRWTFGRPL